MSPTSHSSEHPEDRILLQRFLQELDEGAFAAIVDRYGRMVMSVCRRATQRVEDAEDAFQATFIALARRPRQLRRADSLGSWLYSVAWRTAQRASRRIRSDVSELPGEIEDEFQTVLNQIAHDQELKVLDEELNGLPEHLRTVLVLTYLNGQTAPQIAEELQTTKGVIDGRIIRARKALRTRLIRRGVTFAILTAAGNLSQAAASSPAGAMLQQTIAMGTEASRSAAAGPQSVRQLAHVEAQSAQLPVIPLLLLTSFMLTVGTGMQQADAVAPYNQDVVVESILDRVEPSRSITAEVTVEQPQQIKPKRQQATGTGTAPAPAHADRFRGISEQELMAHPGSWGSVTGQILFDGPLPEPTLLYRRGDPVKDAEACSINNIPDESLMVDADSAGIANCFIYLRQKPGTVHPLLKAPRQPVLTQNQAGCRFKPHALIVQVGQTVDVINPDPVAHNIHTYPMRQPSTNSVMRPSVRTNGVRIAPTRSERLPFKVGCDFHPWMSAWWLTVDHPYAAVTDRNGRFRISGLPVGTHEFIVWHEAAGYLNRKLEVVVQASEVRQLPVLKFGSNHFKTESARERNGERPSATET